MTEDEKEMLRELHAYWFKPPRPGGKSRADHFDEVATIVRTAKFGGRAILWIAAAVAAVGAAVTQMRGIGS